MKMSSKLIPHLHANAPWHKESFDKFISETLPQLLAQRLPLTGYTVQPQDTYTCRISVSVNDVEVVYDVLQPDDEGLFNIDGGLLVVVPAASSAYLDTAEVKCVGEQLYSYVESHLGEASSELPWDEALIRAWLPLDTWVRQLVTSGLDEQETFGPTGQWLDKTNGISVRTHLRRIGIVDPEKVITASQFGRVCPFEVPEGSNIGRVYSIALGAAIRNGRIEIVDDRPEAALGLTASMVPFLECNDSNRMTFGVNMMRQWLVPADPEPALVQTGNEPDAPDIWCGRNLLTAFISFGPETYEDAILISESCAKKLGNEHPVEVGDKISNRHGSKGVISRILPDAEMPHLADGTPIDLVYSFIACHPRLNFGQVREAVLGRIALAEGEPAIVPPFSAPNDAELRDRLHSAGLPEDGMEVLTMGRAGKKLKHPSTVGWVYWGRTDHLAVFKIHAGTSEKGDRPLNLQGECEYYSLRDMECFETIAETYNTRSALRPDAQEFVRQVEAGQVEQAGAPSPLFNELARRLNAAGIRTDLQDSKLAFCIGSPSGEVLKLAKPVPHPWLQSQMLSEMGVFEELPEYKALVDANSKMERSVSSGAPESLKEKVYADLIARVNALFSALLNHGYLRMYNRVMFGGRTVLVPGIDLKLDQVGLADEIAWTIFGPLVMREMGNREQVEKRTDEAVRVLDEIMSRSWVIVTRAPAFIPTATIAFHPVRIPENVIRLHPLVCFLMNGDFDGDQAAVFLPITEAGQREAGEKLSFAGHLKRDPNLYDLRFINNEMLWGLAYLGLQPGGMDEISQLIGAPVKTSGGIVDKSTIAEAVREVMSRDGVDAVVEVIQRLMDRGLQVAKESGASINLFIGSSLQLPPKPESDDPDLWNVYAEDVIDILQSSNDFSSLEFGPQLLAVKSGARGSIDQLCRLAACKRPVQNASGDLVPIKHSLREGYTPEEDFAGVAGAREGLARISNEIVQSAYGVKSAPDVKGFGVLARAMRSPYPGRVFARAAAVSESDPLTDLDSRLFVGLR